MVIKGVEITGIEDPEEAAAYVERGFEKYASGLESIEASVEGDFVTLKYHTRVRPFERIRRITGYLVGTVDRWNSAKRAELNDRVKHDPV